MLFFLVSIKIQVFRFAYDTYASKLLTFDLFGSLTPKNGIFHDVVQATRVCFRGELRPWDN